MLVTSNNLSLGISFESLLSFQDALDLSNYQIQPGTEAVPVSILGASLQYTIIQSGVGFIASLFDPAIAIVGDSSVRAEATVAYSGISAAAMAGNSLLSVAPTVARPIQAVLAGNSNLVGYSDPLAVIESEASFDATAEYLSLVARRFLPANVTYEIQVGDYITLCSAANNIQFARVVQVFTDGSVELDQDLLVKDPRNGSIPWFHTRGLEGVVLTTTKPTGGKGYTLGVKLPAYEASQTYTAIADKPRVLAAEQLEDGQLIVTFSYPMRNDSVLLRAEEYTITGPSWAYVKTVKTLTPTQVCLTTVGLGVGSYQLTVNASSTPYDIAGNPLDPAWNQAVFTGSPAITSRSIFTDRGPITKPALTLQTGATATIDSPTQLTLPTATITPSHIGLYITLTGTALNAGTFRIVTRVSTTVVKVVASFTTPDPNSGVIGWVLFDPRNGEIADDPSDVIVRINSIPVTPEAVIGLLGQIVLPSVPAPTDDVDIDYCWICNPVVDFRRLNSPEFRLNNWNQDTNRPVDTTQHKYRYNNTLIQPATFVPLDMRAAIAQPLQRDLKYRAYERAYSTALNDPNLLLLNSPTHRIAFPPLSRTISSEFVNYQPVTLPEADPVTPWERHGLGTATIIGTQLVVVDNTSGPFPSGYPIFWSRPIDLTYPHVFAIAWRSMIDAVPVPDGVFTGISAGYADDKKATVVGFLEDAGVKKIGILKAGSGNDPSDISAWTGGIDGAGNPTNVPADLNWSALASYRIFCDRTGIVTVYTNGSIVPILRVLPDELPYLEELNDPFNALQGAFFGSLSREATNTSTWNFVRYTSIPINPLQASPSVFITYEAATPPEEASQPWTPVGFHGTETILGGDFLLLDSTSATDLPSSSAAGLISGDFRGYFRIEPLLVESFDTVLDVNLALRTHTHGITPNAVLAAIDDGSLLIQLCFFPEEAAPKFSYGGRALPPDFSPYFWNETGGASGSMVGQYLRIEDVTTTDGLVYYLEDLSAIGSASRVVGHDVDYIFEFRAQVLTYVPDMVGYAGVMSSVYDSQRAVGLMFEEIAGQKYVTFHSDGDPKARFAFNWFDAQFHTYRASKSTTGNLVSLFIDGILIGSIPYSDFTAPVFSPIGMMSFGSSTPLSVQAKSTVLWAYSNFWRVNSGVKRWPCDGR
jgi:hypothetical protein